MCKVTALGVCKVTALGMCKVTALGVCKVVVATQDAFALMKSLCI